MILGVSLFHVPRIIDFPDDPEIQKRYLKRIQIYLYPDGSLESKLNLLE